MHVPRRGLDLLVLLLALRCLVVGLNLLVSLELAAVTSCLVHASRRPKEVSETQNYDYCQELADGVGYHHPLKGDTAVAEPSAPVYPVLDEGK